MHIADLLPQVPMISRAEPLEATSLATDSGSALPAILFVDAYDSFTNNIISLLTTTLHCTVRVLHIDTELFPTAKALADELRQYDAVVLGPGPGNPNNPEDVGLMNRIWELSGTSPEQVDIPILGICLGFQSLGLKMGYKVERLRKGGIHGIVRRIEHVDDDIYFGVGDVDATLYQSLCVEMERVELDDRFFRQGKYKDVPVEDYNEFQPLAWVPRMGEQSGVVLVAGRHLRRPWWGLQYHPESICTNEESKKVIVNWMEEVRDHNKATGRKIIRSEGRKGDVPVRSSLLAQWRRTFREMEQLERIPLHSFEDPHDDYIYHSKVFKAEAPSLISDIVSIMQLRSRDMIILESTNQSRQACPSTPLDGVQPQHNVKGRYTIMALNLEKAARLEYTIGSSHVINRPPNKMVPPLHIPLNVYGGVWPFLARCLEARRMDVKDAKTPFWGGFMGYMSYEMGLEGISVPPHSTRKKKVGVQPNRPDLSFAWVTHSIVVDHETGDVHLQELIYESTKLMKGPWWEHTRGRELVKYFKAGCPQIQIPASLSFTCEVKGTVKTPMAEEYEDAVRKCQDHIAAGDSYELCLTAQSTLKIPLPTPQPGHSFKAGRHEEFVTGSYAYRLYQGLAKAQPAPFASFIRMGAATLVSCSPERFLTWDEKGKCELRPMKGTVKKSIAPTRAEAEALLSVDKETAENLMIVDLVRHDLYGVCGAGNVRVEQLMRVEEYESVWQMVSVVVGYIPGSQSNPKGGEAAETEELPKTNSKRQNDIDLQYSGIDVLAASLPPGSMTGAPKKRSCELLNIIEKERRSLYSGVVGYIDVGMRGDWSVNIRCAFRWDDEGTTEEDTWHIGAGGAVTALSGAKEEREEMETKLFNTLNGLGNWDKA